MIVDLLGSNASPIIMVCLIAAAFILAILATVKICNTYEGTEVPAWLIFTWLFPFIGPLIALFYSPVPEERRAEKSLWREFLAEEPHRKFLEKNQQQDAFESWRKAQGENA